MSKKVKIKILFKINKIVLINLTLNKKNQKKVTNYQKRIGYMNLKVQKKSIFMENRLLWIIKLWMMQNNHYLNKLGVN